MPVPAWAADYIGIPFLPKGRTRAGLDCWGLVRLVLAERFGVFVTSYVDDYGGVRKGDAAEIEKIFRLEAAKWRPVAFGRERLGDVVVFHGMPLHAGLVIGDGRMLHVRRTIQSSAPAYADPDILPTIMGFYRHADVAAP